MTDPTVAPPRPRTARAGAAPRDLRRARVAVATLFFTNGAIFAYLAVTGGLMGAGAVARGPQEWRGPSFLRERRPSVVHPTPTTHAAAHDRAETPA